MFCIAKTQEKPQYFSINIGASIPTGEYSSTQGNESVGYAMTGTNFAIKGAGFIYQTVGFGAYLGINTHNIDGDKYTSQLNNEPGIRSSTISFSEANYGNASIYNEGDYGQKTFYFAYTMAQIEDGEYPNTRDELLGRICNFFDIYITVYSPDQEQLELKIYANPTKSKSIISYYLVEESGVTIEDFDIAGKIVNRLLNKNQSGGNNQVIWDTSELSEGVYFCHLRNGNGVVTKKITKIK